MTRSSISAGKRLKEAARTVGKTLEEYVAFHAVTRARGSEFVTLVMRENVCINGLKPSLTF